MVLLNIGMYSWLRGGQACMDRWLLHSVEGMASLLFNRGSRWHCRPRSLWVWLLVAAQSVGVAHSLGCNMCMLSLLSVSL